MTTLARLNSTPMSDLLDRIDATRPFHAKASEPVKIPIARSGS